MKYPTSINLLPDLFELSHDPCPIHGSLTHNRISNTKRGTAKEVEGHSGLVRVERGGVRLEVVVN